MYATSARLILTFLVLLAVLSCRKSKNEPEIPPFFNLPQGIKDHFQFYPGSYWTFSEDSTGWTDSLYITFLDIDTVAILHPGNSKDTITLTERLTLRMHSPFFGIDHTYSTQLDIQGWLRNTDGPHFIMRRRSFYNGEFQLYGNIFYWPPLVNVPFSANAGGSSTLIQQPAQQITLSSGQRFDNVITTEIDLDLSEFNQSTIYYHAAKKGMIARSSLSQGLYWELKRGRAIMAPGDTLYFP